MAQSPQIPAEALLCGGGPPRPTRETLAAEALLQIKINGAAWMTTVQTPGMEAALVRGLLLSEGVIAADTPVSLHTVNDPESGWVACVEAAIPSAWLRKDIADLRSNVASASCGFCGVRSVEDLKLDGAALLHTMEARYTPAQIAAMMDALTQGQGLFQATGGCHGAALFDANATLLCLAEDIGRHNAVDKCIGALLLEKRIGAARCLVVSGRLSYEIVFKAVQARVPVVAAVSAPSSLAVDTARQYGITLLGFCRPPRSTVYSHQHRIAASVCAGES
ncbi:MAG: formate dehydrogenase accessory sulfurtransferase FdhD [Candidatus Hydrogenedentes bacterium]|nr:formate dehydrogenase accessory sulfurtransferase FdhD [Candidatus Hydrogenedentota bacterium]